LPDGKVRLCAPADEAARPPLSASLEAARSSQAGFYRIDDDPGLLAFAVVVSREPLPTFREWLADLIRRAGPLPWKPVDPKLVDQDVIFIWGPNGIDVQNAREKNTTRGGSESGNAVPHRRVAALANWLQDAAGEKNVFMKAFAVVGEKRP
jgi:hypothetical protein